MRITWKNIFISVEQTTLLPYQVLFCYKKHSHTLNACLIEHDVQCKSATSTSLLPFTNSTLYNSPFTSSVEESELNRRKKSNKASLKIALCTHKKFDEWFTASFSFPRLLLSLNAVCDVVEWKLNVRMLVLQKLE